MTGEARRARMSSLPILQYCGQALQLSHSAGRAAAMGSAFHALCAQAPEARALWAALSDEEQREVESWHRPRDTQHGEHVLAYQLAHKEVPVGLLASGRYCEKGDPNAVVDGTADMYWLHQSASGPVIYLADIKRSAWTTADGVESLQLHGYALALADKHDAAAYRCGIWAAVEGEWHWGPEVRLDSDYAALQWERVKLAAGNVGGPFSTGPHCGRCYSRSRCPAYLVPVEHAELLASPLLTGDLDNDRALELRRIVERLEDTVEAAKARIRSYVQDAGRIVDTAGGRELTLVHQKGRASLDQRRLEKDHPELVQEYTRLGPGFDKLGWRKLKGAP